MCTPGVALARRAVLARSTLRGSVSTRLAVAASTTTLARVTDTAMGECPFCESYGWFAIAADGSTGCPICNMPIAKGQLRR